MSEYDSHMPMGASYVEEADTFADAGPDIIKVSARSRSTAVAGAIAGVMRQHSSAEVQAIGAGAVNQAVKALAIARGYLERDEIDIVTTHLLHRGGYRRTRAYRREIPRGAAPRVVAKSAASIKRATIGLNEADTLYPFFWSCPMS